MPHSKQSNRKTRLSCFAATLPVSSPDRVWLKLKMGQLSKNANHSQEKKWLLFPICHQHQFLDTEFCFPFSFRQPHFTWYSPWNDTSLHTGIIALFLKAQEQSLEGELSVWRYEALLYQSSVFHILKPPSLLTNQDAASIKAFLVLKITILPPCRLRGQSIRGNCVMKNILILL